MEKIRKIQQKLKKQSGDFLFELNQPIMYLEKAKEFLTNYGYDTFEIDNIINQLREGKSKETDTYSPNKF